MKRISTALFLTAVLVVGNCYASGVMEDDRQQVLTSFGEHIADLSLGADRIESAKKLMGELEAESAADAISESLMVLYPSYQRAIELTDEDQSVAAIEALGKLAESEDRFLAADATFYLARTLMNEERFEEALPKLTQLKNELSGFTVQKATVNYYIAVAQAGMLQNTAALSAFGDFLRDTDGAPERLVVSAFRQAQQLMAIKQGQMSDIHQKMDFSRRRLQLSESGEETQDEQEKIVAMLNQLIKEQQKKECSSCNSNKPNTKKQQQQSPKQQQAKKNKPKKGKSQKGGSSSNPNGQVVDKSYDDSPASPWSRLRDRSRDPANNAIKDKLPARYRDLVEKYYDKANGSGGQKN